MPSRSASRRSRMSSSAALDTSSGPKAANRSTGATAGAGNRGKPPSAGGPGQARQLLEHWTELMTLLSILLGIIPLLGIAWTLKNGTITTVDGLFMSLILLTLSGILFLNAFLDIRKRLRSKSQAPAARKTN